MTPPQPTAEWLPIETAPKDGRHILTAHGDDYRLTMWVEYAPTPGIPNGIYQWATGFGPGALRKLDYNPTHWMPLPNPPGSASPTPTEGALDLLTRLAEVIGHMRGYGYRFKTFSGSQDVIKAYHVDEWADELKTVVERLHVAHGGQK